MLKNAVLGIGIALSLVGASPVHATTCAADLLVLASGPRVLFGSTDVFEVSEVRVSNMSLVPMQTIPIANGRFADALDFTAEPNDPIVVTFVTKTGSVICMNVLTSQAPAGRRAPVVVGGGDSDTGGN